jgi:hypothetical protein
MSKAGLDRRFDSDGGSVGATTYVVCFSGNTECSEMAFVYVLVKNDTVIL